MLKILIIYFLNLIINKKGSVKNSSTYMAYYFLIFILIGSMFLINLFAGVIFLNYHDAEKKEKKNKELTEDQQKWTEVQKLIAKEDLDYALIKEPDNKIKKFLYHVIQSNYFDFFILACIIANIVIMALSYEGSPPYYKKVNSKFYTYIITIL